MYRALWLALPGPWGVKLVQVILIASAVVALLFFVVFPFIAQTFLVEQSTVGGS